MIYFFMIIIFIILIVMGYIFHENFLIIKSIHNRINLLQERTNTIQELIIKLAEYRKING